MEKKRERTIRSMIQKSGLVCESLQVTGGNHIAALCVSGQFRRKVFFSATPSDHRGDMNRLALLRRMVREAAQ